MSKTEKVRKFIDRHFEAIAALSMVFAACAVSAAAGASFAKDQVHRSYEAESADYYNIDGEKLLIVAFKNGRNLKIIDPPNSK